MSRCDTCAIPGSCCRYFELSIFGLIVGLPGMEVDTADGAEALVDPEKSTPFRALLQRPNGAWLFWCRNLRRDGRCGDYSNRPGTCRVYEPETDNLCVHGPQGPPAPRRPKAAAP